MWIKGVDLPRELVDAHQQGQLVVFVGAGASMAPPSSLPNFESLARDIYTERGVDFPDGLRERLDPALGELMDHYNVPVNERVAHKINMPGSRPNGLHAAIAALVRAGPTPRLVTTNYDMHLSQALEGAGIEEFHAPALPLGDDFTGLVYLHGSLRQEPRRLVVTDSDFGRAYLGEAWATRFLERMFAELVVLFIGYSHSDLVMSYLARGLGRSRGRYAITADPDSRHWRSLGIVAIRYEVVGGSHDAVPEAIQGWADLAGMGLTDHQRRIADLASLPLAPQEPEDVSYLEMVLADSDRVRFFVEHARGENWLTWASSQPTFQGLFEPSTEPTRCTQLLAHWFADHYVQDPALTATALMTVHRAGDRLGPPVWRAIAAGLSRDEPWLWAGHWLALLLQNSPEATLDTLEYALTHAHDWPDGGNAALTLFDHLTEPMTKLRPSFHPDAPLRAEIRLRGTDYWLRQAWQEVFRPQLHVLARDVLSMVDGQLSRAYRLLALGDTAVSTFDQLTFARSAIEPHEQDRHPRPVDVLVDAARDCLEQLLDQKDALAHGYLATWAESRYPLQRRLAVHGWAHRPDVDADTKVVWLLSLDRRWDYRIRHEVFRLIATAVPAANQRVADDLVTDLLAWASEPDVHPYEPYNALVWITRHAPDLQSAQRARADVEAAHPEWEERDHPDLTWTMENGFVEPKPPMTPEELHYRIADDASSAATQLRQHRSTDAFGEDTWSGTLGVVSAAVQQWPADGYILLDALAADDSAFAAAVINGWAAATLADDDDATDVAERIRTLDLTTPAIRDAVADLLSADGGAPSSSPVWYRLSAARNLARDAWTAIGADTSTSQPESWLGWAINHPAGKLAQFWLQAIATDWRTAGESWTGLPEAFRASLDALLTEDTDRGRAAETVLASQVHFFHNADREWCERSLLPRLAWADTDRARRTWDGFLTWGRPSNPLLQAGLRDHFRDAAAHFNELTEDTQRALLHQLAEVALRAEINPLEGHWLTNVISALPEGEPANLAENVTWRLARLPDDVAEHQWQRWLRKFWTSRLDGIPLVFSESEASAISEWIAYLDASIPEAVALAVRHPAHLRTHSNMLNDLRDDRIHSYAAAISELLTHLLRHTQEPFYECDRLRNVVQQLHASPNPPDLKPLIDRALRFCPPPNPGDAGRTGHGI
jgi:hypothetical protein